MTEAEIQEETGLLGLAAGQLGNDIGQLGALLSRGRLNVIEKIPEQLHLLDVQVSTLIRRWQRVRATGVALPNKEPARDGRSSLNGSAA
jgi:hypothetical protein